MILAASLRSKEGMRVRILREPTGEVDGVSLDYYHEGKAYEMSAVLAEYLVALGCAAVEMRSKERSKRLRSSDRRRSRPGP
jgi:hypothetical protein